MFSVELVTKTGLGAACYPNRAEATQAFYSLAAKRIGDVYLVEDRTGRVQAKYRAEPTAAPLAARPYRAGC